MTEAGTIPTIADYRESLARTIELGGLVALDHLQITASDMFPADGTETTRRFRALLRWRVTALRRQARVLARMKTELEARSA